MRTYAAIITALCFSAVGVATGQSPMVIGQEAVIPLPGEAFYSRFVVPLPIDGEQVRLNPPRFTWFYNPEYDLADESLMAFRFQIAQDADFQHLLVDEVCTYNFYNTLKPLAAKSCYWRVGYINLGRDRTTAIDPQAVSAWSRVRRFTIADDAVEWDRSMLADAAYLTARKHPRMILTEENIPVILRHIEQNQKAKSMFKELRRRAYLAVEADWWRGRDVPPIGKPLGRSMTGRCSRLGAAAFVWRLTGDERILRSRPQEALVRLAAEFLDKQIDHSDPTRMDTGTPIVMLSLCYDWMYDLLTPQQRSTVVRALDRTADWTLNHFWWRRGYGRSWVYKRERDNHVEPATGEHRMREFAGAKIGASHEAESFNKGFYAALAAYDEPDAPWARELFEIGINYLIGKTYAFGYRDGGFMEGAGYVMSVLPQAVDLTIIADQMFPEANLRRNPYFPATGRFLRHFLPAGLDLSPWANHGSSCSAKRFGAIGEFLSLVTNDGAGMKHLRSAGGGSASELYLEVAVPALLPTPAEKVDPQLAVCFPLSGWVMAHSVPVNEPNAVADGVGIIFPCRPQGAYSKAFFSDASPQIYAYGRSLTYGEGRMHMKTYIRHTFAHNGILVDGMGQAQKEHIGYYGSKSFFGRIMAFKVGDNFVYFAGDATNCYPSEKFRPSQYTGSSSNKLYTSRDLSYLQKVRRHVLFMRGKYFVMFDELQTAEAHPSRFTWLFHVVGEELHTDPADPLRFRFPAVHLAPDAPRPAKDDPTVHLVHVARAGQVEVQDVRYTDAFINPLSGERHRKPDVPAGEVDPAHHLYVTNTEPRSRFHFMTVIFPVRPGKPAPRIERIDDRTVEVSADGWRDVVTFAPSLDQVSQRATLAVDLGRIDARDAQLLGEVVRTYLGK